MAREFNATFVKQAGKVLQDNVILAQREIGLSVWRNIGRFAPVWTGRLRASFSAQTNDSATEPPEPLPAGVIPFLPPDIRQVPKPRWGRFLWISTATPYAKLANSGGPQNFAHFYLERSARAGAKDVENRGRV